MLLHPCHKRFEPFFKGREKCILTRTQIQERWEKILKWMYRRPTVREAADFPPAFTIPNVRFSTVSSHKDISTIESCPIGPYRTLKVTLNGFFHGLAESRRNFTKKNASHSAESKRSSSPVLLSVRFLFLSHAGLFPAAQKKHTGTSSASSKQLLLWKLTSDY